ncbi:MAG: hypothetical protein Q9162_006583 [Coniocarpon cinnabarinum]
MEPLQPLDLYEPFRIDRLAESLHRLYRIIMALGFKLHRLFIDEFPELTSAGKNTLDLLAASSTLLAFGNTLAAYAIQVANGTPSDSLRRPAQLELEEDKPLPYAVCEAFNIAASYPTLQELTQVARERVTDAGGHLDDLQAADTLVQIARDS